MQGKLGASDLDLRRYGIDTQGKLSLYDILTRSDYNNRALDQQGAQFGAGAVFTGIDLLRQLRERKIRLK